jgi:hypothetical protein
VRISPKEVATCDLCLLARPSISTVAVPAAITLEAIARVALREHDRPGRDLHLGGTEASRSIAGWGNGAKIGIPLSNSSGSAAIRACLSIASIGRQVKTASAGNRAPTATNADAGRTPR